MRVLVTGGAGFIGSHVVDRLASRGDDVLVVDDCSTGLPENVADGVPLVRRDIAAPGLEATFAEFRPDAVVHLAAQASVAVSMTDPTVDARTNVLGGLSVFEAGVAAGVGQLVYVTTGGALYGTPDYLPVDEDHPIRPESAYGLSKWTLECYLQLLTPPAMKLKVLRLANVYGERQLPDGEAGVVSIFGARMLRGDAVSIHGDGEQTRDFVHVSDVVGAVERSLATPEPHVVNVSTATGHSVNEIFRLMSAASGYDRPPTHSARRQGDIEHVVLANERAHRVLGWAPQVDLEVGLKTTLDWLKEREASGAGSEPLGEIE